MFIVCLNHVDRHAHQALPNAGTAAGACCSVRLREVDLERCSCSDAADIPGNRQGPELPCAGCPVAKVEAGVRVAEGCGQSSASAIASEPGVCVRWLLW